MWTGFYYDGKTADRQAVTVTIVPDGLAIERADGSSFVWPIGDVRQAQGSFSSEHLRLERGTKPVEVVLVMQPGLPAAIRQAFPGTRTTVRGSRSTAKRIGWTSAVIAAGVALYVWLTPVFANWLATRVPPGWEISLGRGVAERMAPSSKQCTDSASVASLQVVLDRLERAAPPNDYQFHLAVLRDTTVNAFALPGGSMIVHQALLETAATPEQFAGVLAHEMQHVLQRHSTRAMIRELPLQFAVAAVAGGSGLETAASIGATLNSLRYRRADEAQADREGMRLLEAARVDPMGAVEIMRTLQAKQDEEPRFVTYFSSHPQTARRVADLEALARSSRSTPTPIMDSVAWQQVRRMCHATP